MKVSISAVEVECPHCGALPLFECVSKRGTVIKGMHVARHANAERIGEVVRADASARRRT